MNMEGDDSSFLASRTFLFLPHSSQKKMMDLTIMPAGTRTEAPNTILGILINLPPPPHENRPKNEAENTTGPWTCVPCADDNGPVQFDTYYKYRRHLKEDHKKLIDVRICEHCGFKAYQINHHFYHLYTEHNIAPPLNYDFPKCDQCDYIGLCQKRLDTHRISKHTGTVTKKRKENKTIHLPQDMTSLTETPTVPSSSDHDHTYAKIMKMNGCVNAGTPISIISSVDATLQTDAESPAKIVQTLVSDRADLDEDNQEESQDGDDESEKKPSGPTIELEDSASSSVRGSRPLLEDLALGVPPTPSSHCPISIRNGSSSVPGTSRQQGSGSSGKASEVVDLRDESGDCFKRRTRIPVKPYQPRVADDDVGRKLPHVNSPECKLSHNCDVNPEQSVRIVEMNGSSSVPGTSRQQGSGSSGKASEVVDLRDESGDCFKRRTRIPVKPYQPRVAYDDVGRKLPHVNSPECKLSHNCDVSPEQSVRIVEMNGSSSVPGTSRQQGSGSSGKASEVVDLRDESGDCFKRRTHIPVKPYQPRVAYDDVGRKLPHVNSPECKLSHNCDVSPEQSVRIVEMNGSSSVPGTSRQQGSGSSGKASEVVDLRDESGDCFKRRTHIPVKPYQPRVAYDDVGRKLPHVNSPECNLSHNCDVSPEQSVRIVEIQRKDGEKEREMKRQVEEEALKKEPYPKHIEAIDERIRRHVKITDVVLDDTEPEEVALPELTDDMQAKISAALRPNPPREELVEGFGQKITRTDIQTLNKLNWLNDEVINFYMNLIIERGKGDKYLSVYAFNTFFYPKLEKQGYSTLRRWTKKVDIFNHKLLLVPIHLGNHWCMATIDFRDKTVRYYDSMGGENNKCLNALLKYLNDESMDKKKASYDISGWKLINMKDIPQQMNGSDCGMFSCMFAEYASRNAKITFSQKDMPYFRNKMVFEILSKKLLF